VQSRCLRAKVRHKKFFTQTTVSAGTNSLGLFALFLQKFNYAVPASLPGIIQQEQGTIYFQDGKKQHCHFRK
jgi:hypothetical protein